MQTRSITVPASAFRYTFRVEPADIDVFGHANNVVWVRWVNDAALAHACSVGLSPEACGQQDAVWVVRRHDLEYLGAAFEGEMLDCVTWAERVQGATSLRECHFYRDGRLLVRAQTTWALVYVSTGKPRRIPKDMIRAYGLPVVEKRARAEPDSQLLEPR